MATTTYGSRESTIGSERTARGVLGGGAIVESLGGIAALVLAVLGLSGVLPGYMVSIAAIAIGVALLAEGSALATRLHGTVQRADMPTTETAEAAGGMSAELLGGIAGATLGILALIGIAPMVLTAVAAIVFGAALLLGGFGTSRVSALASGGPDVEPLVRESAVAAAGAELLVGFASGTLGILALVGFAPTILTLVAFLSVGATVLLAGAALGGTASS